MGQQKYRTKGAKKRNKRAKLDLPSLEPTPKRDRKGCFVERTRQQPDDPTPKKVVLMARCKAVGRTPDESGLASVDHQSFTDDAGIALNIYAKDYRHRDALWNILNGVSRAEEVYHRRILGQSMHAKCGKIEFMPERLTSDVSAPFDDRSEDEKDRGAVNTRQYWHGIVMHLDSDSQRAFWNGAYLRRALHGLRLKKQNGKPDTVYSDLTDEGLWFCQAVDKMHKIVNDARRRA